jgi:hypothetical protein
MKLRLLLGTLALVGVGLAAASCGSSGESTFPGGDGIDSGIDNSESGVSGFGKSDGGPTSAGGTCKPLTCKDLGVNCGPAGDGCGGKIECGTCTSPATCGGGGKPSVCGGTAACIPRTCAQQKVACGPAGDGCGGTLPNCGTCPAPEFCGGGGASQCGGGLINDGGMLLNPDGGLCVARTVCNAGECGPVADGCGGILNCSGCAAGQSCGGGGVASMCGAPACVKTTCMAAGATCGYVADGCGGLLDCGGSMANAGCAVGFCGGGGANKCGTGAAVDAGTCVNFCLNQAVCPANAQTTITGTVTSPDGRLPLPGAVVYVPNGSLVYPYGVTPFVDGVSGGVCDTCNGTASGNPLVNAVTSFDGTFTLSNVPAGVSFPLVVQMGRWRKIVMIPAVTKCTTAAQAAGTIRLPTKQHEGGTADSIPLFALSTGFVDGLECVFRKLGIADTEFTNPGGTGRIQFYQDDGAGGTSGARIDSNTPSISSLVATQAQLEKYDATIFACAGGPTDKATASRTAVLNYANEGGRVFATHYNYTWLYDVASPAGNAFTSVWGTSSKFIPDNSNFPNNGASDVGLVDTTANGGTFDKWLNVKPAVNALSSTAPDRVAISDPRYDAFLPLAAGAQSFITEYNPPAGQPVPVFHYAFNTPLNAAKQCGRVIFSDFHVSIGSSTHNKNYPAECPAANTALTSQEKVLAYMLFDLTSCITPVVVPPPTCTKVGCGAQTCGPASDGCGGQQDCGVCPANQVCQGAPAKCVTPPCTKTACKMGQCGSIPDGCGATLNCGSCAMGQVCGGAGASMCGTNSCAPTTCMAQGVACGPAADGCGGLLQCGTCPAGQTCGGGGVIGQCGAPMCTPRTCAQAGATCGVVADGCGGALNCGTCSAGQTCGGGGTPNQCGGGGIH